MLRYQPAIGPSLATQVTRYLSQPACPTYLGFDPRIQLVHEDDALDALVAAIRRPVRGAVNVAASGTIGLARMIRHGAAVRCCRSPARCSARSRGPGAGSGSTRTRTTSGACCATAAGWTSTGSSSEVGHRPRYSTVEARRGLGGRGVNGPGRAGLHAAPARGARRGPRAARGAHARRRRAPARGARHARARAAPARGRPRGGRVGLRRGLRRARSSPSSASSTTAGGGSRSRAPTACPPTAARCSPPTTPASCPGTRR